MAKATNALTRGISGKVSGLVFRQHANGKVSVGDAPRPTSKAPGADTLARRHRFQQAALYGRAVQQDPARQAAYATGITPNLTSAYAVAVADFLNPPTILGLDVAGYHGRVGNLIVVQATDDFAVREVRVRIEQAGGAVLEEGPAIADPDGYTFRYAATVANATPAGCTVVATALDTPGNETTERRPL